MFRVVMYVLNDVTHDSRVLREAASLAAAGHAVTVIGTTRSADEPDGSREERDGFAIVRVALPTASGSHWRALRAPWRAVAPALGGVVADLAGGPRRWGRAARTGAGLAVMLPWLLLRGAWVAVVNRMLRRPVRMGWLEYIRRWRVENLGWCRRAVDHAPRADVHHAHDMETLFAARAAAGRDGARYVYDSHEVFTEWGRLLDQPRWLRAAMARWERRMARDAAGLITVNPSIAAVLRDRLGVERVVVVHNCPPRWSPPARPEDRIRHATGIPPGTPVVLCHGNLMAGRGLEETAAAMCEPGLEAAHLVFLGYRVAIVDRLLADPGLAGRVHLLPPVPPAEVVAWVAGGDVDVMAILPADLNSRLSTPNKLFESLAAGVPVVSSDLPERRRIVVDDPDGPLGELCEPSEPASIARAIRRILDLDPAARADLRRRILRAAHERWNWERESAGLLALYDDLGPVSTPPAATGRTLD